jgi:hypothetical protein
LAIEELLPNLIFTQQKDSAHNTRSFEIAAPDFNLKVEQV